MEKKEDEILPNSPDPSQKKWQDFLTPEEFALMKLRMANLKYMVPNSNGVKKISRSIFFNEEDGCYFEDVDGDRWKMPEYEDIKNNLREFHRFFEFLKWKPEDYRCVVLPILLAYKRDAMHYIVPRNYEIEGGWYVWPDYSELKKSLDRADLFSGWDILVYKKDLEREDVNTSLEQIKGSKGFVDTNLAESLLIRTLEQGPTSTLEQHYEVLIGQRDTQKEVMAAIRSIGSYEFQVVSASHYNQVNAQYGFRGEEVRVRRGFRISKRQNRKILQRNTRLNWLSGNE